MPSIPKPSPIRTKPVELAITQGELPTGLVYFKTMRDYEHMALNMADILRYIKDSQIYMRQCK